MYKCPTCDNLLHEQTDILNPKFSYMRCVGKKIEVKGERKIFKPCRFEMETESFKRQYRKETE